MMLSFRRDPCQGLHEPLNRHLRHGWVCQAPRSLVEPRPTVASPPVPRPSPPAHASATRPRRVERSGRHGRPPPERSHAGRETPPWSDHQSPKRSLPVPSCSPHDRADEIARPVSGDLVDVGLPSLDVPGWLPTRPALPSEGAGAASGAAVLRCRGARHRPVGEEEGQFSASRILRTCASTYVSVSVRIADPVRPGPAGIPDILSPSCLERIPSARTSDREVVRGQWAELYAATSSWARAAKRRL